MKKLWMYLSIQTVLMVIALIVGLRLWETNLNVPLIYSGDGILFSTVTKAVGEGSLLYFKNLGAPYQLDFVDFAFAQFSDFTLLKLIQQFGMTGPMAINLYWMFCVLVSGILASWSFFRLGLSAGLSSFLGFIFAITPWTFFRHIGHLLYHLSYIPLTCLVILFIALGRGREFSRRELGFYFLSFVLMGINNTYYAFFACTLFVFAFLYRWVESRKIEWKLSLISIGSVLLGTAIGVLPGLIYWARNGKGFALNFKFPAEADIYGMKIRHFLQPIPNHPFSLLRRVDELFTSAQFPLENENLSVRLGLIGSFGLIILMLTSLRLFKPSEESKKSFNFLASASIFIFLVASIGGLGSFFNTLISPQIRCYNRMGVFICFFSLVAVGMWWAHSQNRLILKLKQGKQIFIFVGAIGIFAVFDQIPTYLFRNGYALAQSQFQEEKAFVQQIEQRHTGPDMIFQLPFTEYFGDGQDLNKMQGYDNGRLYLHSIKTHWTWGSVSARDGGWWKKASQLPAAEMIHVALLAGFTGISVDSFAYKDNKLLEGLEKNLGSQAVWSSQRRYAFLDLTSLLEQQKTFLSSPEAELERVALLSPLEPIYQAGVYQEERSDDGKSFRWCKKTCEIWIKNSLSVPRKIQISLLVNSLQPQAVSAMVDGRRVPVNSEEVTQLEAELDPMTYKKISLESTGPRIVAPSDPRKLYFRVQSFELKEVKNSH
jgi:phosphoglycerol transferase